MIKCSFLNEIIFDCFYLKGGDKMAKAKMMNESSFAKLVKELSALGELIRTRQEEKQAVIDEFDKEKARYRKGKISEDTMKSSSKKSNKEFSRINRDIRVAIVKSNKLGMRIREFIGNQSPKIFITKVSGINLKQNKKVKKPQRKKVRLKKSSKKRANSKRPQRKKSGKSKRITRAEIVEELKQEKKLRR